MLGFTLKNWWTDRRAVFPQSSKSHWLFQTITCVLSETLLALTVPNPAFLFVTMYLQPVKAFWCSTTLHQIAYTPHGVAVLLSLQFCRIATAHLFVAVDVSLIYSWGSGAIKPWKVLKDRQKVGIHFLERRTCYFALDPKLWERICWWHPEISLHILKKRRGFIL